MEANELFFSFLGIAFILALFYNGYQQTVRDNEHAKIQQSLEITQQAFLNIAQEHKTLLKILAGKIEIHSKDTKEILLPKSPVISEQYYEYVKGIFQCGDTYAITIHSNLAEMLYGDMDNVLFKYYNKENLDNLKKELMNGINKLEENNQ
jgi:hypothetical protein